MGELEGAAPQGRLAENAEGHGHTAGEIIRFHPRQRLAHAGGVGMVVPEDREILPQVADRIAGAQRFQARLLDGQAPGQRHHREGAEAPGLLAQGARLSLEHHLGADLGGVAQEPAAELGAQHRGLVRDGEHGLDRLGDRDAGPLLRCLGADGIDLGASLREAAGEAFEGARLEVPCGCLRLGEAAVGDGAGGGEPGQGLPRGGAEGVHRRIGRPALGGDQVGDMHHEAETRGFRHGALRPVQLGEIGCDKGAAEGRAAERRHRTHGPLEMLDSDCRRHASPGGPESPAGTWRSFPGLAARI